MGFEQAFSHHHSDRNRGGGGGGGGGGEAEPNKKQRKKRSIFRISSKSSKSHQINGDSDDLASKNSAALSESSLNHMKSTSSFSPKKEISHGEIDCDDVNSVVSSSCGSSDMVVLPVTVMSDDAAIIHRNQSSSEVSDSSPLSLKAKAFSEGGKLHDSESSYDSSDNGKSSNYGQSKSRTLSTLTRSSSKRAVRILFKKNSFNQIRKTKTPIKNSKMSEEQLNVERATCSSIIKDSRFPEHVELEPGQTESQRNSFVKVCPYHHCSLNGHCHDPPPQKKPFLRRRTQSSESGKTAGKVSSGSGPEAKRSAGKKKGSKKDQIKSNADFLVHEASHLENEDPNGSDVVLDGSSDRANNSQEDFFDRQGNSLKQEGLNPEAKVEVKESSLESHSPKTEVEKSEAAGANSLALRKTSTGKGKPISMWHLIHKHMVSDLAEEGTKPDPATDGNRRVEEAEILNTRESSKDNPDTADADIGNSSQDNENQEIEIRKLFAIKLVREAIEKILLPEVQDQLSENQSIASESVEGQELNEKNDQEDRDEGCNVESATTEADVENTVSAQEMKKQETQLGKKSDKKSPSNWSNLKKWVLLQRFVKELEKVRKINYRKPRQQQMENDPSAEKVSLRRQQTGDEKKKSEEWMLDYALQHVVSQLAPTQRRKVALLVKAFETVVPPQEDGPQIPGKANVSVPREDRKSKSGDATSQSDESGSSVSGESSNAEKQNLPVIPEVHSPADLCSEADNLRDVSSTDAPLDKSEEIIDVIGAVDAGPESGGKNEEIKVASEQTCAFPTGSRDVDVKSEVAKNLPAEADFIQEESSKKAELDRDADVIPSPEHSINESVLGDTNYKMDEALNTSQSSVAVQIEKTAAAETGGVQVFPPQVNQAAQVPLDKQTYLRLWHSVCQHVVSTVATKLVLDEDDEETEDANKLSTGKISKGIHEERHHKAEFTRSQVLKLVKEAVQEILSPEIQDESSDTASVSSEIVPETEVSGKDHNEGTKESKTNLDGLIRENTGELDRTKEDSSPDEEKESTKEVIAAESSTKVETVDKSSNDPPKPRNWRKLKQLILLKRSIKAMEKARKLKFPPQQLLPPPSDQEPEKVDLRHQMTDERRKAEQWMLDYAVQHIVTKLTPARKKRVAMLVEAFEAVVPLPEA